VGFYFSRGENRAPSRAYAGSVSRRYSQFWIARRQILVLGLALLPRDVEPDVYRRATDPRERLPDLRQIIRCTHAQDADTAAAHLHGRVVAAHPRGVAVGASRRKR